MLKRNSYWLKSGIYTILEKGGSLIFSFGSVILLYRHLLSIENAGVWVQFLTVTTLIELARNGLVQNGLIKFISSSDKSLHPKILSASLALNFILSIVSIALLASCAYFLSTLWHAPILEEMFYIYIATTILLIPYYHFQFVEQGNFSFKGIFYSTLVRQGIFFAAILLAFLFELKINLIDITILQFISIFFATVTSFFLVRKYLIFERGIDLDWIKKLFNYGKFVFGTNISGAIFSSIDQMMLGNIRGNDSVALYNTAIRVSNVVEVPINSVATIIFPQSAKRMETSGKGALKDLYEKSVALIIGLILPVSVVVLLIPHVIINFIWGEKFIEAVPILQITIFYTLIAPFTRQFGTIIDSMGKPKLNFYFTLGSAILNIVLNYFFIHRYGLLGAAYGTLTTYIAMFLFTQTVLFRILRVRFSAIVLHLFGYYKEGFTTGTGLLKRFTKPNGINP